MRQLCYFKNEGNLVGVELRIRKGNFIRRNRKLKLFKQLLLQISRETCIRNTNIGNDCYSKKLLQKCKDSWIYTNKENEKMLSYNIETTETLVSTKYFIVFIKRTINSQNRQHKLFFSFRPR